MVLTSRWTGVVVVVVALLCGACSGSTPARPSTVEPTRVPPVEMIEPRVIADFTLTDQDGDPFRLGDSAGFVRMFYFGYTSCPDICPTTMVDWRDTAELLGADADQVKFVLVTVDPDVDTPSTLKRFLGLFNPDFIGLSGSAAELGAVWDEFGVSVERLDLPASATGHSISHSSSAWVIDQEGMLRMKFRFDAQPEDMARAIRRLLRET